MPADPKNSITKRLSNDEVEERKKKGLCFHCDEKYSFGHKCKKIFNIEGFEEAVNEEEGLMGPELLENIPQVSLNALHGRLNPETIKVLGRVKNNTLAILVDTGSTHIFLDPHTARRLGCEIVSTASLSVTVADGSRVNCNYKCPNFQWEMGAHHFLFDMRILKLGGCDIVLGVDFMRRFGPVLFDYNNLSITLRHGDREITIQGLRQEVPVSSLNIISAEGLEKMIKKDEFRVGCFCVMSMEPKEKRDEVESPEIKHLLSEFQDVFQEPTGLPPLRGAEHHIILKDGAAPFKMQPYRYSYMQRKEIDRLVEKMLQSGIIQTSSSPFASPVLLVKKKDGSWRFCVDYRKLNAITVKDSYPIPLVDDLLDELGKARIFTKIDLRTCYHHIRVRNEDVGKTAFVVASGHYEFKFMPFGLTNAPATSQSLMNEVFRQELKEFVLVFFDDILVYSPDEALHYHHLKRVLELLRSHSLFAKASKCSFAHKQVEYLGHVINEHGVGVDPSKIQSIQEWPLPQTVKALRGFLGLTGYYRKFVKGYGVIAKPLTALLKKGGFTWNEQAKEAFLPEAQESYDQYPVLQLPDFSKPFILETDASYGGIGAVLM